MKTKGRHEDAAGIRNHRLAPSRRRRGIRRRLRAEIDRGPKAIENSPPETPPAESHPAESAPRSEEASRCCGRDALHHGGSLVSLLIGGNGRHRPLVIVRSYTREGQPVAPRFYFEVTPMHEMTWDFELRSAANLKNTGSWRYAADPTTEILCLCYAIEDGEAQTWLPRWVTKQLGLAEQPVPEVFHEIATNPPRGGRSHISPNSNAHCTSASSCRSTASPRFRLKCSTAR